MRHLYKCLIIFTIQLPGRKFPQVRFKYLDRYNHLTIILRQLVSDISKCVRLNFKLHINDHIYVLICALKLPISQIIGQNKRNFVNSIMTKLYYLYILMLFRYNSHYNIFETLFAAITQSAYVISSFSPTCYLPSMIITTLFDRAC